MNQKARLTERDQERVRNVHRHLSELSPEADPSHFARYLTAKQQLYANEFVRTGGDWKRAAVAAGYGPKSSQRTIEEGGAMYAYMTAIKAQMATAAAITSVGILASIHRMSLRAEAAGEFGAAIRGQKLLGDSKGLFGRDPDEERHYDKNGVMVVIVNGPSSEVIDAEYSEVLERNGIPVPSALLPRATEDA